MSLRYQINLRIVLTSMVILLLGGSMAIWQARNAVNKEIDSSLNIADQLIQLNFPQIGRSVFDVSAWLSRFVSLEQTRHLKIQLKKPDGETLKFTAEAKVSADNDMPPFWFVNLVSRDYREVEQQLVTNDGQKIVLVIRADPLDEIGEAWKEGKIFFVSLLVMALLTVLTINLVFNKAFKAITVIIDGLKDIEQGCYQQKLPEFSTLEYSRIAKAVNHLTDVLDAANKQNSALALHSLEIQEEERQRLAQELHDELGQSLTAIKVMAVTANKNPGSTPKITSTIIEICDHLIKVVRSMMRNLHPLVLTELGLKATLEDLFQHWAERHPELVLRLNCADGVDSLEHKITIQVFRIVQECITNIVRHAHAREAIVSLSVEKVSATESYLRLQIADNGKGCLPGQLDSGFGLLGIRERVKNLGGTIDIQSMPAHGMAIRASIPLQ